MMWSSQVSACYWLLLFFSVYVNSTKIEPISFGIITNNDFNPTSVTTTTITLFWNKSSYQCIVQPSTSNELNECDLEDTQKQSIKANGIFNKIQISSSNDVSIKSIIIWDDSNNHHQINEFCLRNRENCIDEITTSDITIQFPLATVLMKSQSESHKAMIERTTNEIINTQNENMFEPQRRRLQPVTVGNDQDDIDHFEFTLSAQSGSSIIDSFYIWVYWKTNTFGCFYNTGTPVEIPAGATVKCYPEESGNTHNGVTFDLDQAIYSGPGNLFVDESYKFQLDYSENKNGTEDLTRISSLKVYLVSGDYYEINSFCVPKQFNTTDTPISSQTCDEYPHKYQASELELSFNYAQTMRIDFLDAIPEMYANQAKVGLVEANPPITIQIYLSESMTANDFSVVYTLYWDEWIYKCSGLDSGDNGNALTVYCDKNSWSPIAECDHESYFKLHVYNPGESGTDVSHIQITQILIEDYRQSISMENFCIEGSFDSVQVQGTRNGVCADAPFDGITEWTEVCVGDGDVPPQFPNANCTTTAIEIIFPDNLFQDSADLSSTIAGKVVQSTSSTDPKVTCAPTADPTRSPTSEPTIDPTIDPTTDPTFDPTSDPTIDPTIDPTTDPTIDPTKDPTTDPTVDPTTDPTFDPTIDPTTDPTIDPTIDPTTNPTTDPTTEPIIAPTIDPTSDPTADPTQPSSEPTSNPTSKPSVSPTTSDPTLSPTEMLESEDALAEGEEDNGFMAWLNEDDTNKIIAGVGVAVLLLICCLICYICFVTKRCCFKKEDTEPKPEPMASNTSYDTQSKKSANGTLIPNSPSSVSSLDAIVSNPEPTRIPSDRSEQANEMAILDSNPSKSINLQSKMSIVVPLADEFIVTFHSKPFGMKWSTLKTDKYNLYVSEVEPDSVAAKHKVAKGCKLVALNGESIEGIGSQKIYQRVEEMGLPLSIMFRRRDKAARRASKRRKQTVPSQSGEGVSEFDDGMYEPGTPLQSPSNGLQPVLENKSQAPQAAFSLGGVGDGGMTGTGNIGDDSDDSDDQMYKEAQPPKIIMNTPNGTTSDRNVFLEVDAGNGSNHVANAESMELAMAASTSSNLPDDEKDSTDDDETEEMYNKNGKKITKAGTIEGDEDDAEEFVFET